MKGNPRIRRGARGYKGKVKEGVHEGREVKPHWDEVQQADDPMGIDLAAADVAERTRRRWIRSRRRRREELASGGGKVELRWPCLGSTADRPNTKGPRHRWDIES